MYIVFEGLLGSGKTTQSKRLVAELKTLLPGKEILWTREPGGSEIAEFIRVVVQATPFHETMEPICEAYLFAASRAQSLRRVVKPVLEKGGIVVADRSFFSSVAWQGFGRSLGLDMIVDINARAVEDLMPDLVIQLEVDPQASLKRTFDAKGDKFETEPMDFHERCATGYKTLSEHSKFKDIWRIVDGRGTAEEVFERVIKTIHTKNPNVIPSGLFGATVGD